MNTFNQGQFPVLKYTPCVATKIVLLALCQSLFADTRTNPIPDTPLAQFKAFLASPPLIDAAVYRITTALDFEKGLPETESESNVNTKVQYFFARWQPNCIFLKSGTNRNVAEPGRGQNDEITARFHSEFWKVVPPGFLTTWKDSGKSMSDRRMQPSILYHNRTHEFREMMNMGVMQAELGAITTESFR
jgi:hypothetical protein